MSDGSLVMSEFSGGDVMNGRFANQVLRYVFLKTCAKRYGLTVRIPKWDGNYLFGTDDPLPDRTYTTVIEKEVFDTNYTILNDIPNPCDIDIKGYCQYHTSWYTDAEKEYIKTLFPLSAATKEKFSTIEELLTTIKGESKIGFHIRRGDYGFGSFPIIPVQWYIDWINTYWSLFYNPVLYIATDDPSVIDSFKQWNPIYSNSTGFFADWYALSLCNIMVMPNSSFSYSAAMVGKSCKQAYRCELSKRAMVPIDIWNDFPTRSDLNINNYGYMKELWL